MSPLPLNASARHGGNSQDSAHRGSLLPAVSQRTGISLPNLPPFIAPAIAAARRSALHAWPTPHVVTAAHCPRCQPAGSNRAALSRRTVPFPLPCRTGTAFRQMTSAGPLPGAGGSRRHRQKKRPEEAA